MPPIHLLVLERDPARRDALLALLRAAGHHAVAAPSGAAAATALEAPGFEALLLDLGIPELDLARLREALAPAEPADPGPLEDAERRHIALMLRHTGGNKRLAAHLLGISRSTLLHKVRKYGLTEAAELGREVTERPAAVPASSARRPP
jgi:DNA-binding NtrC family response regulator